MDHDGGSSKHSTPVNKNSKQHSGEIPQRHIQVNLSREYFNSLASSNEFEDEEEEFQALQEEITKSSVVVESHDGKNSDSESGVTPITHDGSPIKGIIKKMSDSPNERKERAEQTGESSTNSGHMLRKQKSPKKVRITEPPKRREAPVVQSITEMEGIRAQLKSMIGWAQNENQSNERSQIYQGHQQRQDSYADNQEQPGETEKSFDNAAMFRGLLSYSSPPLQLDENGVMFGHGLDRHGVESTQLCFLKSRNIDRSSPQFDASLVIENSMLKESIDREKQRRKHCEDKIQSLQKQTLDMQQQLAVAVATDRKKAIMIEQLDKTLGGIVAGWKKHEAERLSSLQKLREENGTLRKSQNKQQELLGQFEKELAQAVESLTKEQTKTKEAEKDKQSQIKRHKDHLEETEKLLEDERQKVENLNANIESINKANNELIQNVEDLETQIEEDRKSHIQEREELQKEIDHSRRKFQEEIQKLQETVLKFQQESQEENTKATSFQHDAQRMEIELDAALREKESLKMEMSLLESKFEAVKIKEESEQRAILEEEFNRRINIIQDEIFRTESQLKAAHKEQIAELNQRHKEDLELQLERFHEELSKREENVRRMKESFEIRLSEAQDEIMSLTKANTKSEAQRKELTRRLQSLMQQHIQEAVSLISMEAGSQISTPIATSYQVPGRNPVNSQSQYSRNDPHTLEILEEERHASTPFSSTATDWQINPRLGESISTIRSVNTHAGSLKDFDMFKENSSQVSHKEPDRNTKHCDRASALQDSSMNDILRQLTLFQSHGERDKHALEITETVKSRSSERETLDDTLSYREKQFQTGLQELSDKLKQSRSIDQPKMEVREERPASDVAVPRSSVGEQLTEKSNWDQIQELLRSKLDEVENSARENSESESLLKKQMLETAYVSPRETSRMHSVLDDKIAEQEDRQASLTSFIQKLLNKSPGNPTENDVEDEKQIYPSHENKSTSRIDRRGQNTSTGGQSTGQFSSRTMESMPVGSDSVTRDEISGNLRTPPKVAKTSLLTQAFKKSVLRERPTKPTVASPMTSNEISLTSTAQKSPRKSPSKKLQVETSDEKKQLTNLMKALGIKEGASLHEVNDVINMLSNMQKGLHEEKQKPTKTSSSQQNGKRSSKSSLMNQTQRSHSQKPQKSLPQKTQGDDVFSRLQKIYSNSEELQSIRQGGGPQNVNPGQKSALSKGQAIQSSKAAQTKGKDQRKVASTVRQSIHAWK